MKLTTALFAGLACVLGPLAVHAATVEFPGPSHRAVSPNGQSAIINKDRDTEPNHTLWIEDKHGHNTRKLMTYPRYVDTSWSPDSDFFFVNDYYGSDAARCVIVEKANLHKINTETVLQKEIGAITARYKGSSWRVTCSSWEKGDKVKVSIKVSGNGTNEEVIKRFLFNARSGAYTNIR